MAIVLCSEIIRLQSYKEVIIKQKKELKRFSSLSYSYVFTTLLLFLYEPQTCSRCVVLVLVPVGVVIVVLHPSSEVWVRASTILVTDGLVLYRPCPHIVGLLACLWVVVACVGVWDTENVRHILALVTH